VIGNVLGVNSFSKFGLDLMPLSIRSKSSFWCMSLLVFDGTSSRAQHWLRIGVSLFLAHT